MYLNMQYYAKLSLKDGFDSSILNFNDWKRYSPFEIAKERGLSSIFKDKNTSNSANATIEESYQLFKGITINARHLLVA